MINIPNVEISDDRIQELGALLPGFANMPLQFTETFNQYVGYYLDKGDNEVSAVNKAWALTTAIGAKVSQLGRHFRLSDHVQTRAA